MLKILLVLQPRGLRCVVVAWWNVINVTVCLLVLTRLCCIIGIVFFFYFRLASGGRSKFIGELASMRKWMVQLCAFLLLPVSGPLSILYAHFRLS